jgi:hypothetical protein
MTALGNESPVFTALTLTADMRDFRREMTTIHGRGHAVLTCKPCRDYGHRVGSRTDGQVGPLFRALDLVAVMAVAATHQCPPEVRDAR